MATLDWSCETVDGVTLVELLVTAETAQRVCIESNLRPVWPPRRQGQPVAGWNDGCFEKNVEAGERVVVGYASPAEPVDPPAEIRTQPPDTDEGIDPEAVVRVLGDGTPPRDAVPDDLSEPAATGSNCEPPPAGSERADTSREMQAALPPAIEAYFDALDRRLTAAEQLADPETVDQAQTAVTAAGGIGAVDGLDRQLRADRTRLDRLATRRERLASRLDRVEIPVERLERLT